MDYGKPIMVGVCNHCGLKVPIYDTHTRLIMATHGMFEVGPEEGNVTCPGSHTGEFQITTSSIGVKA